MRYKFSNKKGFSLVEILFVLALMTIMSVMLLLNQNNNKAQDDADNAAGQIIAQLRSLQNDSLTGKMFEGTPNQFVCRSIMKLESANAAFYKIAYNEKCGAPNPADGIEISGSEKQFDLKNAEIETTTPIIFAAPAGTVADSRIVVHSARDSSKKATVCVYKSGNITEAKDDVNPCPAL